MLSAEGKMALITNHTYHKLDIVLEIMHCARNLQIIHLSASTLVNNLLVAVIPELTVVS